MPSLPKISNREICNVNAQAHLGYGG